MGKRYGQKIWMFPDGDRPPEHCFRKKAYEAIMILNPTNEVATVHLTAYYTNRMPVNEFILQVPAERVRCFQTNGAEMLGMVEAKTHEQYALVLESSTEIIAQYLKMSDDDQPMHVYGMMGYGCDYIDDGMGAK